MFFTLLAALCAGLAAGCTFMLVGDLLGKVEVDSMTPAEGEDPSRLPLIFRIFLPLAGNVSFLSRKDTFVSECLCA